MGSYPARQLQSQETTFVGKGTLAIHEGQIVLCVNAGESLLLWPQRSYIGVGQFPADLKFYWLHFEVIAENDVSPVELLPTIPQHVWTSELQHIVSLLRQFLRERENIHHSVVLELILLPVL